MAAPVGLQYKEVPGLGDSVLPWEHCLDVPGQEAIDESIHEHHDDDVHHGEVVACHGAVPDVVPLYPHSLLLKLGNLKAAKAKGNTGGQALVEKTKQWI